MAQVPSQGRGGLLCRRQVRLRRRQEHLWRCMMCLPHEVQAPVVPLPMVRFRIMRSEWGRRHRQTSKACRDRHQQGQQQRQRHQWHQWRLACRCEEVRLLGLWACRHRCHRHSQDHHRHRHMVPMAVQCQWDMSPLAVVHRQVRRSQCYGRRWSSIMLLATSTRSSSGSATILIRTSSFWKSCRRTRRSNDLSTKCMRR